MEKTAQPQKPSRPRHFVYRQRRKVCRFCADPDLPLDYKRPDILKQFMSERGKILPRRMTGLCAYHQRRLSREIKRARIMGLLPFSVV